MDILPQFWIVHDNKLWGERFTSNHLQTGDAKAPGCARLKTATENTMETLLSADRIIKKRIWSRLPSPNHLARLLSWILLVSCASISWHSKIPLTYPLKWFQYNSCKRWMGARAQRMGNVDLWGQLRAHRRIMLMEHKKHVLGNRWSRQPLPHILVFGGGATGLNPVMDTFSSISWYGIYSQVHRSTTTVT